MLELIQNLKDFPLAEVVSAILMILGGASVLAKLTPTQADDKVINGILKFIQTLGLNK